MRQNSLIWLFIPLVAGVPISFYAVSVFWTRNFSRLPVLGKEVIVNGKKSDHTIPAFHLTDQNANTVVIEEWDNKVVVANFFFTHCPVVCPQMTKNLKRVQQSFDNNDIFITSFSVDPERDSVSRLQWYAERFKVDNKNWQLLTGDKKEIYKLARNGFMLVATDGDGGPDDFIHSEQLVLIDPQKRIRGYYNGTNDTEVARLIHDIKKLKNEN